jgi:hypothetical protein
MGTSLSLRRLWVLYKRTAIAHGTGGSKRDLVVAQVAFYSGARAVLKVLDHMSSKGDFAEVQRTIERHSRQINRLQGRHPRARRH